MRIEDYLRYNSETGDLFWIKALNCRIIPGVKAGSINNKGYLQTKFNKTLYKNHRVAWYLYYGEWPSKNIDHINRDRTDNRIENLRLANHRENSHNTMNFNYGVYFLKRTNRWRSSIRIEGKYTHLGYFDTKEEAQEAYKKKVEEING